MNNIYNIKLNEKVLNMMLGVQMAVKSAILIGGYRIQPKDFELKYYFELIPRFTTIEI